MQLFLLVFIVFIRFQPIKMVALAAQLEMCNFLSQNAVFGSEQHNVVGQVGSLFKDGIPYETQKSKSKQIHSSNRFAVLATNDAVSGPEETLAKKRSEKGLLKGLKLCLAVLRPYIDSQQNIHLNLTEYDEKQKPSPEYAGQMKQWEHFLMNGRTLFRTAFMNEGTRLKYSKGFWSRVIEDYLYHENQDIVNVTMDIMPEEWPPFMPIETGEKMIGNKFVKIHPVPFFRTIDYLIYGDEKSEILDCKMNLGREGGKLDQVTIVIQDGQTLEGGPVDLFGVLLGLLFG